MRLPKSKMSMVVLLAAVILVVWAVDHLADDAGASLIEAIEARGSRILGTRLDVSEAELNPGGGAVSVSGLVVANPGGFSDEDMISVDNINVQLDPAARVIERISLTGAAALVEFRGAKSNFEELGERIAGNARNDDSVGEPQRAESRDQADDSGDAGQAPVPDAWQVERVELDRIRVTVRADWTSEVIEYRTDALSIENLDAGIDDLARTVVARFLDKVLASAAAEVDDERVRERLMEEAEALRARFVPE